jgi:LAO/AO transport system kinase
MNNLQSPISQSPISNLSRHSLARLLTGIENGDAAAQAQLREMYGRGGNARTVGITGAPGCGKSTLVTAMVKAWRSLGKTVAVVAVDPSSPFTNGAILGDRYRMNELAGDPGVFVRSMASRGALGGLASAVFDAVTAFDASGFDVVVVETVGAGQNEIDVAWVTESVIVVEAPGMGDEVQAIKAGILEIADVVVVNKADRDGAEQTVSAIQSALDAGQPRAWRVPIHKTVATQAVGVNAVLEALAQHKTYLDTTGKGQWRWEHRVQHDVLNRLREMLLRRALSQLPPDQLSHLLQAVAQRELHPMDAAKRLLEIGDWRLEIRD